MKIFIIMEAYFEYHEHVEKAVHDYKVEPDDILKVTVYAIYDIVCKFLVTTVYLSKLLMI